MSNPVRVNLGAGLQAHEWPGYIGVDKMSVVKPDIVWDCENGLPKTRIPIGDRENYTGKLSVDFPVFHTGSVDEFLCKHFLEHLSNDGFMRLMNEMHDALKPTGILRVMVPNCEHPRAAYGDPTHKMRFHVTTFNYFTHKTLAAFPYTDREWEIVDGPEARGTPPDDLWEIYCVLRPVK